MADRSAWPENNAKWIWIHEKPQQQNQYVEFRGTFKLEHPVRESSAFISVDSDYELWINGHFAGWNQYPNWPQQKTFNEHNVGEFLKGRKLCVAIRVYYRQSH